jgi:hypothetical protein
LGTRPLVAVVFVISECRADQTHPDKRGVRRERAVAALVATRGGPRGGVRLAESSTVDSLMLVLSVFSVAIAA